MFNRKNRLFGNRYTIVDNNNDKINCSDDTTNDTVNTANSSSTSTSSNIIRYHKERNINIETSNVMKYKNFKWPKKDENWTNLINLINIELDTFQEDDNVNLTIVSLRDTIVNICDKHLPRKSKGKNYLNELNYEIH